MLAKKVLAVAVSLAVAVPAFSMSTLAAQGDMITVGGQNVKLMTDMENFKLGRVGYKGDTVWSVPNNNDTKGYNFQILDGYGANGSKGLFFGLNKVNTVDPKQGETEAAYYSPKNDGGIVDWSAATDVVLWIDATKYQDTTLSFQMVIQEWDMNTDGTAVLNNDDSHAETAWGADNSTFYTLQDGATDWVTHQGQDPSKGDDWFLRVPTTFKGYVRVPVKNLGTYWGTTDTDGKIDLKHIDSFNLYHGFYTNKDWINGGAMTIDNIGFIGNFQQPTTTTTTTTGTTTTTTGTDTTTTTGTGTTATTGTGTTATTGTGATTTTTTGTGAVNTTTGGSAIINTSETNADTTAAAASTDATTGSASPKTGEAPITAALLTAVAFAGVLVASKKRNK